MEKQISELYRLYRLAAQGDADAQYRLGMRYLNGIGTPQNLRLAYIWIGKAADRDHVQAKQDILHLRTAGIEAAAIEAGIPTSMPYIPDNLVPAPEGYRTDMELPSTPAPAAVVPESVPAPVQEPVAPQPAPVQPVVQQAAPAAQAQPVQTQPEKAWMPAERPAVFHQQKQQAAAEDAGSSPMKKILWGLVIILIILAIGWYFKGGIFGGKKSMDDGKEVAGKAVILTDKDQKSIAQKVFDKYYGDGTYKNGCWSSNGYCMKFKQVYAVPSKDSDMYTLNVYAYDAVNGTGRIDAYTVEVDAKTPNDFRVVASRSGVMADPTDGKKVWKFAKDGKSWSIDSRKEHDGVRDYLRTTYQLVGNDIRFNRELLKSEPIVVENTDDIQNQPGDDNAQKPDDRKSDKIEALIKQKEGASGRDKQKNQR